MIYIATKVGINHKISEDAVLVGKKIYRNIEATVDLVEPGFICVADGVGGNEGGAKASQFVLEAIAKIEDSDNLEDAFNQINNKLIKNKNTTNRDYYMATTLTGVYITGERYKLFHVGNTRAYVKQGMYLKQLTSDHTTYNWLKSNGQTEAAECCNKSEITNCFGGGNEKFLSKLIIKDIPSFQVLVLTSDGIHDYIDIDSLENILCDKFDYIRKAEEIIEMAQKNGSEDDLTVVIINNNEY